MVSSALQRSLRTVLGPTIAERARVAAPSIERYVRDPFAHLDDGHVLILGLARDESADEDVVVSDTGLHLAPQVFRPYDYEREIGAAWIDLDRLARTGELRWRNGLGEKSRQMGWTWTTSWLLLWTLMYFPESRGFAIHLDRAMVDDGGERSTTESIFGRIRYMAESRIPTSWGLPAETTWPETMRPSEYLGFKQSPTSIILNRLSGATLVGGAAVEDPGRGVSYTHVLVDEFARVPYGNLVHRAISRTTPTGRLYGSTPAGKSNRFYELVSRTPPGYSKVRLHWSRHPIYGDGAHVAGSDPEGCVRCAGVVAGVSWDIERTAHLTHRYPDRLTSPWYDDAVAELTDEDVAQELDISYEASTSARVYPQFDATVHVLPEIRYDDRLPIELSFDYGYSPSATAVGIWQDAPDSLRKIGEVEVTEATPERVAELIRSALVDLGVPPVETGPRFTRSLLAIGDISGEARTVAGGQPIVFEYAQQGFTIISERYGVRESIRAMQRLLMGRPKPVRYSARGCPKTIVHMENHHWPTDRAGVVKRDADKPVHDAHSHMCFPAGTLVELRQGPTPIEQVREGDYALTRRGWHRVAAASETGIRAVVTLRYDGGELTGTPDHPVWVIGEGWRPLGEIVGRTDAPCLVVLEKSDRVVTGEAEEATDLAGRVVMIDVESPFARNSAATAEGRPLADRADSALRLDKRFVLRERDSVSSAEPVVASLATEVARIETRRGCSPLVGAAETASSVRLPLRIPATSDRRAAVLARARTEVLETGSDERTVRVARTRAVSAHLREREDSHVARAAASRVPSDCHPAVWTRLRSRMLRHVVDDTPSSRRAVVYNVSVESVHEFFADGVLVHNCDADRYYVRWKFEPPSVEEATQAATSRHVPDEPRVEFGRRGGQITDLSPGMRL